MGRVQIEVIILSQLKILFWVKLFCIYIFLSSVTLAQSIEKPFLWEIEGSKPSYLFGTIHLPDPRVTTFHSSVEHAFDKSDYVYTEIPLDTQDLLTQVSYLMLEGDTTLVDIVPVDLLQRAENQLQKINPALTIEPFLKFKVWALATSLPLLEQQLSNPGAVPLDAQIYQRAQAEGKGVGGLETMQEQMHYFDSLTQDEELKMLRDTVEFMEQADASGTPISEEFVSFYIKGDIDSFSGLMVKYVKEDEFSKEFMKKILHDRNYLLADRIAAKIKNNTNDTYFFAVGAGHFGGETGIQHLLRQKGIDVIRVE